MRPCKVALVTSLRVPSAWLSEHRLCRFYIRHHTPCAIVVIVSLMHSPPAFGPSCVNTCHSTARQHLRHSCSTCSCRLHTPDGHQFMRPYQMQLHRRMCNSDFLPSGGHTVITFVVQPAPTFTQRERSRHPTCINHRVFLNNPSPQLHLSSRSAYRHHLGGGGKSLTGILGIRGGVALSPSNLYR